jgi:putative hydrolase of the HAD superfamily
MPLVIFDLDNTLIDREAAFLRWAEQFVTGRGLGVEEVQWLVDADGDGFVPRAQFVSAVRERYGLDVSPDVLLSSYRKEIVGLVEVDPRVPVALDRLRDDGWAVAIATNGSTRQQSAKIRKTGLDAHVDAIAISEEVGVAKPDRRIFHAAAQRSGCRLEEGGWMVGDCPARDVAGGRQVGLRTIWLHRGRAWDSATPAPEAVVGHVSESVAVLTGQPTVP